MELIDGGFVVNWNGVWCDDWGWSGGGGYGCVYFFGGVEVVSVKNFSFGWFLVLVLEEG